MRNRRAVGRNGGRRSQWAGHVSVPIREWLHRYARPPRGRSETEPASPPEQRASIDRREWPGTQLLLRTHIPHPRNSALRRYRLTDCHLHRGQPVESVRPFSSRNSKVFSRQLLGDGTREAIFDKDSIDGANWGHFGRRTCEKDFISNVEELPRNRLFDDRNSHIPRQGQNRSPGDAG